MFRANIIKRQTLEIRDFSNVIDLELNVDLLLPKVSLATLSKIIDINEGDLILIVDADTNDQIFLGVIAKNEINNGTQQISFRQFNDYFELSVVFEDYDGKLGNLVTQILNDNYINSPDPKINVDYFIIVDETDIDFILEINEEGGDGRFEFENFNKILYNLFRSNYFYIEPKLIFNSDGSKNIQLTYKQLSQPITQKNLNINLTNIVDVDINTTFADLFTRADLIRENELPEPENFDYYYLLKNGDVTDDPNNPNRIETINNVIFIYDDQLTDDEIQQLAEQLLQGNQFSHLVEIEIKDNNTFQLDNDVFLGDLVTLYGIQDEPLNSILTGYVFTNSGFNILNFGVVRLDLTDQLIQDDLNIELF